MAEFFRRVEKKYILTKNQYLEIKKNIEEKMIEDFHGKSTICNVYYDSPDFRLIRNSITKPVYKDKIRVRSYNTPKEDDTVFLEVKRKYQEVVSKRRIGIKLNDFYKKELEVGSAEKQVKNELDYYFKFYNLEPKMYVSYYRRAYFDKNDDNFRLTFDSNIQARNYDWKLEKGSYGEYILEPEKYVMEIKTIGEIPLWFVELLNSINARPCGYSKYGEAYTQIELKANTVKECVI